MPDYDELSIKINAQGAKEALKDLRDLKEAIIGVREATEQLNNPSPQQRRHDRDSARVDAQRTRNAQERVRAERDVTRQMQRQGRANQGNQGTFSKVGKFFLGGNPLSMLTGWMTVTSMLQKTLSAITTAMHDNIASTQAKAFTALNYSQMEGLHKLNLLGNGTANGATIAQSLSKMLLKNEIGNYSQEEYDTGIANLLEDNRGDELGYLLSVLRLLDTMDDSNPQKVRIAQTSGIADIQSLLLAYKRANQIAKSQYGAESFLRYKIQEATANENSGLAQAQSDLWWNDKGKKLTNVFDNIVLRRNNIQTKEETPQSVNLPAEQNEEGRQTEKPTARSLPTSNTTVPALVIPEHWQSGMIGDKDYSWIFGSYDFIKDANGNLRDTQQIAEGLKTSAELSGLYSSVSEMMEGLRGLVQSVESGEPFMVDYGDGNALVFDVPKEELFQNGETVFQDLEIFKGLLKQYDDMMNEQKQENDASNSNPQAFNIQIENRFQFAEGQTESNTLAQDIADKIALTLADSVRTQLRA